MIQIHFDNNLIDEDYYTSLSTNFSLFNDTFFLGSTAANAYKLSIAKEAIERHPSIVTIKDEGVLIATLVVDEVEENDFEYIYTLMDKMVDLEFKYDASEIFTNGSATLLEIAQDICNKVGIELATMDFRGYNKGINWYDNTRTAREYIGYIAELNGGYAQIGKDGRLYFIKQNTPSAKTISIEDCSDFKIGEKHKITRVIYEQGTLKYEYGDESGNTLYLNGDNVYITDQTEVEEIYNEIKGFEFYSFKTSNCPIDYNIMAGQVITFEDGENSYPTIAGYDDLTFNGDWYGGYNLDVATKKQEETQVIGTSEKIRDLSIKVDRESNKITQAIKEIDNQNNKISQVTQTVDELNSKIGDIADITTSQETLNGTISFEGINQSEPIYVKIYPTGVNISYLYPRDNLYPSETLFMTVRTLRFINTTTNEYVDYELPTDLLYYDAENYDEFILDYDAQTCVVNKRVGYNADGTTYVLDKSETIEYEYPRIELTDGDYTITLLGYHNAYMLIRLMAQNIYTTQFATKAEVNSEIKQTTQEINISVDKKLENYSTTTQMNAAINVKSEQITSTVAKTYETKEGTDKKIEEAKGEFKVTTDAINAEVEKKVNQSTITGAYLILQINGDTSEEKLNADKIELSANDVLNLLAGNEINLSSKNITMKAVNLTIDKNGNLTCNNATMNNVAINGGNIVINNNASSYGSAALKFNSSSTKGYMSSKALEMYNNDFSSGVAMAIDGIQGGNQILAYSIDGSAGIGFGEIWADGNVYASNISSDQRLKENIEESSINAIETIKKIQIRSFDWKDSKKHIDAGYIAQEMEEIDENFVLKRPILNKDGQVVDYKYYMNELPIMATLTKGFQEQQELIEQLQKEIRLLKGEK